jgi:hypothetical protein
MRGSTRFPARMPWLVLSLAVIACRPPLLQLRAAAETEHAYAIVGDSLVVAVSARGRSQESAARMLAAIAQTSASRERCEPAGRVTFLGASDPRLGDDVVRWLAPPRLVGVIQCIRR